MCTSLLWHGLISYFSGFPWGSKGAWTSSSSISEYSLFGLWSREIFQSGKNMMHIYVPFLLPFINGLIIDTLLQWRTRNIEIFWATLYSTLHYSEQYCNTNVPLLGSRVHRVPQSIIWVVLKGHPGCWVPLGVFLPKTFLSVCAKPQFLTFTKLHNQNVCIVESTKMFQNWNTSGREDDLKKKLSAQPWNELYTHHPVQHSHWGHYPDSWTSPEMPRKIKYCFQSSLLIQ